MYEALQGNKREMIDKDIVINRLEKFIEYFVDQFEAKLSWYCKVLDEEGKKGGTLADVVKAAVITSTGGTVAAVTPLAYLALQMPVISSLKMAATVATKAAGASKIVAGSIGSKIGEGRHKAKAASLSELVYNFKNGENKPEVREILVTAGFDIFQSFELQFMRAKAKNGGETRAMMKLARDAVYRVINYCAQKEEQVKALDLELITNGLISGESKKGTISKFVPGAAQQTVRKVFKVASKPGRTVVDSYSGKEWNTDELYSKVGLAVENPGAHHTMPYRYYKKKEEITEPDKYGYRRRFIAEKEKWGALEKQYKEDENIGKSVEFTHSTYQYRLDPENSEERKTLIKNMLDYLNQRDPKLMEDRIKEWDEECKKDILAELEEIKNSIDFSAKGVIEKIIKNLDAIEEEVLDLIKKGEEYVQQGFHSASQQRYEIAGENTRQHEKTRSLLLEEGEEIKSLLSKEKDRYIQKNLPERWNIPPKIADNICIERKRLQDRIENALEVESKIIITALHGLGGVGKTQLVLDFIQKHEEKYKGVCWFNSKDTGQLLNQYAMLGRELNIFDAEEKINVEEQALRVKNWLENSKQKGWLLVYDNVPNYEAISKFIPTKGGKVIITSRHTEWPQEDIAVGVFDYTEADAYIQNFFPLENMNQREDLANKLGRLPLALAQACAYINKNGMNILRYLEIYEEKKIYLLSKETLPPGSEHDPVFITWNVTMDEIRKESNLAAKLLTACAYLDSNIPQSLLKMLHTEAEVKPFEEVLGILLSYSMLTSYDKWENVSIHNLVQDVIRLQSKNEARNLKMVFDLLKASLPCGETLKDYSIQRKLLPHFEAFLSHLDDWLSRKPEARQKVYEDYLQILELMCDGYNYLGNPKREKELLEGALAIKEKHYGSDHFEVAITLGNLGNAYRELGDHHKQRELLERALAIEEGCYGSSHFEVAITLVNLSTAYWHLGNHEKQKELLERALAIKEGYYGRNHFEVAGTLVNLSTAYWHLGNHEKQKELLERALPIQEEHYGGRDHVKVAKTLVNLSTVYSASGDYKKQEELLKDALSIQEKHYGRNHFEVAGTLANLSNVYGASGDYKKQEELLKEALSIQEKHYGSDHFEVAITLASLGIAYGSLGDPRKKKELLEQALTIIEKHYGRDHVEVARTLVSLSDAYGNLSDHEKQKKLLESALPILENNNHPLVSQVKVALNTLGNHNRRFLSLTHELFEGVKNGNRQVISKLHSLKADDFIEVTNARNDQGHTLLQVAIANKHRDIATELSKMLKNLAPSSSMESVNVAGPSRSYGNLPS